MKAQTVKNGIGLYLLIGYYELFDFLNGKKVFAWPTQPVVDPENCRREEKNCYPFGRTQIRVDPDQVDLGNHASGVFTIRKKGAQKRPAGGKPGQRLHHSRTSLSP